MRPSYLYNGNSYTGNTISLHWIGPKGTENGFHRAPQTAKHAREYDDECGYQV